MDKNNVNVEVTGLRVFSNEKNMGLALTWSGNIGFGEYTIWSSHDSEVWFADSESMDSNSDKWFAKKLFEDLIAKLEVKS